MCPVTQSDGHDAPGLIDELVPGVTAVVDDVGLGAKDAIGQPVVADELPDILDRVQFGTFGRQRHQRDIGRHHEAIRQVPPGLVEQQHGVRPGRHRARHLGQVQVHRCGVAAGQDEPRGLALPGADGAKDIGRGGTLVLRRRRSGTAPSPAPGDLVLLADTCFVGKPDLYRGQFDALLLGNFVQEGREFFLKCSIAPSAWA